MSITLSQFAREAIPRLERLVAAEEISVPDCARLIKKDVEYVRRNFPIIVHGPKSHHIKLSDIEAYQAKRTVRNGWKKV